MPHDRPRRSRARTGVAVARRALRWLDAGYLPPLRVYLAAGVSGLTSIVGTFFVKEHLGLSAAVLVSLGFWATLPWVLEVPLGHVVDLYWRHKHLLVWAGAALIAASLLAMVGLLAAPAGMAGWATLEAWYVLATMLGAVGYVMQDVVADAMTVEAVHVVLGVLTIASAVPMLPFVGMTLGLHEWTAARTGGLEDARFIALANTALDPLCPRWRWCRCSPGSRATHRIR